MITKCDGAAWIKGCGAKCKNTPPAQGKVTRMVLLGAPGVGKGTLADQLSERAGLCQLSTGEVFRAAKTLAQSEITPALETALEYMRGGKLVSDETVIDIVRERLKGLHCPNGFMLDGFPRTPAQAAALDNILQDAGLQLDVVLDLDMPLEKIVERLSGRRLCSGCKAGYHVTRMPSKAPGVCDRCGGKLIQREDDREESIRVRMDVYLKSTKPLIDYYSAQGLLLSVDADGYPEETYVKAIAALKTWKRRAV